MKFSEANFDGLVGPTHNYAGLSLGNVASTSNAQLVSQPKAAALQGLAKMKALHDLGMVQGVLAPQCRPDIETLRRIGFSGSDEGAVVEKAFKKAPHILAACYSASSMWTANAATVSPSPDTLDGKVHFTPANLVSQFHRSIEPQTTQQILTGVFANEDHFKVHQPLPSAPHFGDEGAANHTRFCSNYGHQGVEFFVYGQEAFDHTKPKPSRYPARQTLEASQAVVNRHGLSSDHVVFAQQNPEVIDQGVFHNDVIAVGNGNILFHHEQAFLNTTEVYENLSAGYKNTSNNSGGGFGPTMEFIEVKTSQVSVEEAVKSYLFNSQLITLPSGETVLVAPEECRNTESVWAYLQELIASSGPIKEVKIYDVKQSMQNGGGPACLRLRVVLSEEEQKAVNPNCLLNDELYGALCSWVERHYRDEIALADLADPLLIKESREALDELTTLLALGSIYPFQK